MHNNYIIHNYIVILYPVQRSPWTPLGFFADFHANNFAYLLQNSAEAVTGKDGNQTKRTRRVKRKFNFEFLRSNDLAKRVRERN